MQLCDPWVIRIVRRADRERVAVGLGCAGEFVPRPMRPHCGREKLSPVLTLGRVLPALSLLVIACHESPARRLIVDQPLTFCATAPDSTPLDLVLRTQWSLEIAAGEVELPDAITVPEDHDIRGAPSSAVEVSMSVVGGDAVELPELEATVFAQSDRWLQADAEHDLLVLRDSLDSPLGSGDSWSLSLELVTDRGDDFSFGSASRADLPTRYTRLGCTGDVGDGPCPNRTFEVCDPGGPITRTRVELDRGEVLLDLATVEAASAGGPARMTFVAAELRIDGIAVVQHDFHSLLASPSNADASEASYAVLAPDALAPGEVGCAIVLIDLGTPQQRAHTADCDLRELAPLAILSVTREHVE